MGELREKHTIEGPFADWDPVGDAILFLRTNRYQVVSEDRGEAPAALVVELKTHEDAEPRPAPEDVLTSAKAARGSKWGGFFSSNLAELQTNVTLTLEGNSVIVEYVVNTTGQILQGDERDYWRRESVALQAFLRGEEIVNLVEAETERASDLRRDMLQTGLWAAGVLFVLILLAGVILARV